MTGPTPSAKPYSRAADAEPDAPIPLPKPSHSPLLAPEPLPKPSAAPEPPSKSLKPAPDAPPRHKPVAAGPPDVPSKALKPVRAAAEEEEKEEESDEPPPPPPPSSAKPKAVLPEVSDAPVAAPPPPARAAHRMSMIGDASLLMDAAAAVRKSAPPPDNPDKLEADGFAWLRAHTAGRGLNVDGIESLRDGLVLIAAMEDVTGTPAPRHQKAPKLPVHMIDNLNVAIKMMAAAGIPTRGVQAEEIHGGARKMVLILFGELLKKYPMA